MLCHWEPERREAASDVDDSGTGVSSPAPLTERAGRKQIESFREPGQRPGDEPWAVPDDGDEPLPCPVVDPGQAVGEWK